MLLCVGGSSGSGLIWRRSFNFRTVSLARVRRSRVRRANVKASKLIAQN